MSTDQQPARITWVIVFACIFVYAFGNPWWLYFWPINSPEHRWWQYVTYAFVHGSVIHLLINVLALLSFGPTLERAWGRFGMLACYLAAVMGGAALQSTDNALPVVGASAGIFGLFSAYTLVRPKSKLTSLFVIPMPAWLVLPLYGALSVLAWLQGWLPGVAHLAHVGGAVTGVLFALAMPKENPRR